MSEGEVFLYVVGVIVLLVGADDVTATVADCHGKFVQTELFGLLVFLSLRVEEDDVSLLLLRYDSDRVHCALFVSRPLVYSEIVHLNATQLTFTAKDSTFLKAESTTYSFSSERTKTEETAA